MIEESTYRIVGMQDQSRNFTGTLEQAIDEASESDADVFLEDECVWVNPQVTPAIK